MCCECVQKKWAVKTGIVATKVPHFHKKKLYNHSKTVQKPSKRVRPLNWISILMFNFAIQWFIKIVSACICVSGVEKCFYCCCSQCCCCCCCCCHCCFSWCRWIIIRLNISHMFAKSSFNQKNNFLWFGNFFDCCSHNVRPFSKAQRSLHFFCLFI